MESLAYPDFQYHRVQNYSPPGAAGKFLYETLLRRYLDSFEVQATPIAERIGACWIPTTLKLNHKWVGSISMQHMAYLMRFPLQYDAIRGTQRYKRLRIQYHQKCGNKECYRPDHVIPHEIVHWRVLTSRRPVQRNARKQRDEWLTYPETRWLQAEIACSTAEPLQIITEFAERVALSILSVADIWRQFVLNEERQFAEWSIYDYE